MIEEVVERFGEHRPKPHQTQATAMHLEDLRQELSRLELEHLLAALQSPSLASLQDQLTRVTEYSYNPQLVAVVEQFCERNHLQSKRLPAQRSLFFQKELIPRPSQLYAAVTSTTNQSLTFMKPVPEGFAEVLDGIEASYGMMPNLETLLMHFPGYLKDNWQLNHLLTESNNSPLEHVSSYMLAIMAVATYGCLYLFRRCSRLFLEHGGDPEWLKGNLPQKLAILKTLNCKLAYSPWSISKEDYQPLSQHYSLKQISYIVVLLSYYQSLACITMANGIRPEQKQQSSEETAWLGELKEYPLWNFKNSADKDNLEEASSKVLSLADLATELEEQHSKTTQQQTEENRYSDSESPDYMRAVDKEMKSLHTYQLITKAFSKLLDPDQKVERFDHAKFPTLQCTEFGFQPGVFVWLQEQDQSLSVLVSNLLGRAKDMTNQIIGEKQCSTIPLRQAIRYYYENLCGYHHEHYNYKQKMTNFLSRELKFYLKVATIYPFLMQSSVLRNIPHQDCVLSFFDTVHISLLSISTKFELTLIWAIRSLKGLAC